MAASTDLGLDEAQRYAECAADAYLLPQTVYRNADSGGWWHTNPFASFLRNAELHVTVLPTTYFT
jgi:hypothetical protein